MCYDGATAQPIEEATEMTVEELLNVLTEAADAGYGDTEVRIASQPSYPLAHTVKGLATPDDYTADYEIDGDLGASFVWLVEGGTPDQPYAPSWPFEVAR